MFAFPTIRTIVEKQTKIKQTNKETNKLTNTEEIGGEAEIKKCRWKKLEKIHNHDVLKTDSLQAKLLI